MIKGLKTLAQEGWGKISGDDKWETIPDIIGGLQENDYIVNISTIDNSLMVNGQPYTDEQRVRIANLLHDHGVKAMKTQEQVLKQIGYDNPIHPIGYALENLVWDGHDHIADLSMFIGDAHEPIQYEDGTLRTVVHAALRRWLIAAAGRAITQDDNSIAPIQNYVLTLGGKAGIGKSTFVRWLASPFEDYYVDEKLDPKDALIQRKVASTFLWEIPELASVTKTADVNALKHIITQMRMVYKKPYAKDFTKKKPLANWCATANLDGSPLLFDQTGNRRFWILKVTSLDHRYESVNIEQVWAQAAYMYLHGEPTSPTEEEVAVRDMLNAEHTEQQLIGESMPLYFEVNPMKTNWRLNPLLIGQILATIHKGTSVNQCNKEAASWMTQQNLYKVGNPAQWSGIRVRPDIGNHNFEWPDIVVDMIESSFAANGPY